jgi:hypothetical protein
MVNKEPGSSGKSLISSSNKFWIIFTFSSSFRSTLGSVSELTALQPINKIIAAVNIKKEKQELLPIIKNVDIPDLK